MTPVQETETGRMAEAELLVAILSLIKGLPNESENNKGTRMLFFAPLCWLDPQVSVRCERVCNLHPSALIHTGGFLPEMETTAPLSPG